MGCWLATCSAKMATWQHVVADPECRLTGLLSGPQGSVASVRARIKHHWRKLDERALPLAYIRLDMLVQASLWSLRTMSVIVDSCQTDMAHKYRLSSLDTAVDNVVACYP